MSNFLSQKRKLISYVAIFVMMLCASTASAYVVSDDFTGTTINTAKWTETDPAGLGGATGNVVQNGNLRITGAGSWSSQNGLNTASLFDRTNENVSIEFEVTKSTCGSGIGATAVGFGDVNFLAGDSSSYVFIDVGSSWQIYYFNNGGETSSTTLTGISSCTNGVPTPFRIVAKEGGGVDVYANGSGTPNATLAGGTFTNKSFWFGALNSSGITTYDNVNISAPMGSPINLVATPASGHVSLTWTAPASDSPITDYVVQYKLSTEPTTWTTFNDGTSTTAVATVTGLTNGLAYNFRVSAVNSEGTGPVSSTATASPAITLVEVVADDFTGTTIDTAKWTEIDPAGTGGTTGNVIQNGNIRITGAGSWGSQNGIVSATTYDRSVGDVSMQFEVTKSTCGTGVGAVAVGYGDINFTAGGSASYILIDQNSGWGVYYFTNSAETTSTSVSGLTSCTNGVPTTFRILAKQTGGVSIFVNGSSTASATLGDGSFTNKTFWFGALNSSGTTTYDNVHISISTANPGVPTDLAGTAGDGQVALTWTAPTDEGASAITDYTVQYRAGSDSYTTFSRSASAATAATVIGLTNGVCYDFKVAAVNAEGTSTYTSPISKCPISATPAAPTATSVSISGNANVGENLTGSYTYIDANGNTEGASTFRWLRSDTLGGVYTAITGATALTYALTSDDLGKYIKFEVTPISIASPTTGTPTQSSATGPIDEEMDYLYQILSTGQSLSIGESSSPALTTTQPYDNKMLSGANGGRGTGTSLIPLVESSVETMSSSMANSLTSNDLGNDLDTVVLLHGASGAVYTQLKKGTTPFANGMTQVTNAKNAATVLGRASRVLGVTNIHGETDNFNGVSGATYQGYLEEWQNDYDTDVKAITGQSAEIPMFITQLSSFMSSYANDETSEIPIYQLAAAEENPGEIVMVAPKYFLNYSDRHHLTPQSTRWLGEYHAKVIKKVSLENEEWKPLTPDDVTRAGNIIYATFHVPEGELVFDTTLVSARTNYGFEYFDSTASASISSVEILDEDTVKITLSGVPAGSNQRLRYAYTGVAGTNTGAQNAGSAAGNLRDTDDYPSLYGNTLYNWAVHFDKAITTDVTTPNISSVSSTPSTTSASITWITNEAASSIVDYGATNSYGTSTSEADTSPRVTSHTVGLTGLTACTVYHYRVKSNDASSNLATGTDNTFTTTGCDVTGPIISSVSATPSTTTSSITWTTDEAASSIINYGLTTSYGSSTSEADTSPRVTSHTVGISGLVSCTTYHYRVRSNDASANLGIGTDNTFTTTGCTGSASVSDQASSSITAVSGGTVTLTSGSTGIELDIPAGATGSNAVYQIKSLNQVSVFGTSGTPTGLTTAGSYAFDLKALTGVSTSVTTFLEPIEITLTYQNSDVSNIDESSLWIYRYDGSSWTALTGCVVNTTANTVTCTTLNFSVFSLFGTASASTTTSTSSSSSTTSGGGISYACKDPKAINYDAFGASNPSLCKYAAGTSSPTLGKPGSCSAVQTLTQNLKSGSRNGKYNLYTKAIVNEAKILQVHMNRLGFSSGKEDGILGPISDGAIKRMQTFLGTKADGYVGPLTRGLINNSCGEK